MSQNLPGEKAEKFFKILLEFFSSGVFFMIVGGIILFVAYRTLNDTHSSFTFVLVVTGLAILLYGTGTQGVGEINSESERAKYKIQMAGGAGVLTFCIAFGIVWKAEDIKHAFQIEKRYFGLVMTPQTEEGLPVDLEDFAAEVVVNGSPAPAFRNGNDIIVHVPYFLTADRQVFRIRADFHYVGDVDNRPAYYRVFRREEFELPISTAKGRTNRIGVYDGSYDFPRYEKPHYVNLFNEEEQTRLANTDPLNRPSRPGAPDDNPVPLKFEVR